MKKAMVVIVDMQNAFRNEWTEGLDEKILDFLDQIRDTEVPVVGTRYVNSEHTACYQFEGWKDCMAGSEGAEIMPLLRDRFRIVFDKDRYSCWDDRMKRFVRENGIEKIYFAGVNTGCCVLHSAFDCYNDVVDCSVIADLCASTSGIEEHEAALTVLKSCITKERVITATQAISELV